PRHAPGRRLRLRRAAGPAGQARRPVRPVGPDPELLDMSAATLAILGDYVPFGIGQALGARAGGNSLDNTLRIGRLVPTEWVLLDVRVHAIRNGFGHGDVHLWAEDGTLLATASQSTIVRFWREDPPPVRTDEPEEPSGE